MPRLSAKEQTRLDEANATAKYIGCAVSTSFHGKLQAAARKQGMSLGGFLRESLIDSLYRTQKDQDHDHQ